MDEKAPDQADDKIDAAETAKIVEAEKKVETEKKDEAEKIAGTEKKTEPESKDTNSAAVVPVVSKKTKTVGPKDELSTLDLATGVLLLVLLSLLVTNTYVVFLGKSYNERICREAIGLAGKAANDGSDTQHIQVAAMGPWEHCPQGGFFIEQPLFSSFKDEISEDASLRVIKISTSTKVRIPAPVLLLDKSTMDTDQQMFQQITFENSYEYKLSNPKGVRGKFIKTPRGYVVAPPKKDGAPAAKTNAPSIKSDKPGAKPESKPDPKSESKPEPKLEPKSKPKPAP